ncbi:hypothetical protein ACJMK2_019356 [Sinanodonta woodiana]|uniref:SAM domain-containing protein n=1 Tax=Sinanodonta woodiana TaxID=1069815 RepID=A0ABD3UG57_SINWO
MEFVVSNTDYSVNEFYKRYSSQFPVLVVITEACHGSNLETTFSKGQVLRLTSSITKKRVVGYPMSMDLEHSQECWSIPLDKDITVVPVDQNLKAAGDEMPLPLILSRYKPPVVVEFPNKFLFPDYRHCRFMNLTSVHNVVCMIGNQIHCGKLDSNEIEVPTYRNDLRLRLISGLKNHSKEEFEVYCKRLDIKPLLKDVQGRHRALAVHNPEYERLGADFLITQPRSFHTIDKAYRINNNNKRNEVLKTTDDQKMSNILPSLFKNEVKPLSQPDDYLELLNHPVPTESETTTDRTMQNTSPPPIPPKSFRKEGVKSPSHQNDSNEISNPNISEGQASTNRNVTAFVSMNKSSISSYTIKKVEQTLKELRLQKHFKTFEEQMVDGKILSKLNEEILVKEFGLSRTEAIRLMSFVLEGHIPT